MTTRGGRIAWTVADQGDHLIALASPVLRSPAALTAVVFDGDEVHDRWQRGPADSALSRRLAELLNDLGMHARSAFDDSYRLPGALIRSVRVRGRVAEIEIQADVVLRTTLDLDEPDDPVAIAYSIADWAADGKGTTAGDGSRTFSLSD